MIWPLEKKHISKAYEVCVPPTHQPVFFVNNFTTAAHISANP